MKGLEAVREKMIAAYAESIRSPRWYSNPTVAQEMDREYATGLKFVDQQGYIVIMQGAHVGGYIVNNEYDEEFEYGDFLLADYDMSPRRTYACGNVIRGELDRIGPYGVR